MEKVQTIEDFYRDKLNWMPDNLKKEMGHFNVFRSDDFTCCKKRPVPYSRKDYYKISLLKGRNLIHYADRTVQSEKFALLFANPMIPYNWEPLDENQSGYFCIFTEDFFSEYGSVKDYPMFKAGNNKVYILSEEQLPAIEAIYNRMFEEIASDFLYKYNALRGLVFNLIHSALKLQPAGSAYYPTSNASTRIASLFAELLERQFPIESPMQRMKLRSPKDFSEQLSVHINHLNRSLKEVTGKTTSQLISERVSQEARALLKHTNWNISEIAFCLGFEELPHFINFFKKNFKQTPKTFRDFSDV
jgi:AraC family transcriptional regulator, transcriptional activator of pobA